MELVVLIALLVLAVVLSWTAWRESARLQARRRGFLDSAGSVLEDVQEIPLPSGFVKVEGTYRGYPALLEPVIDTLAVRKLPVLWLMITVPAPVAVRGTFDLMMRASGTEVFSRYHQLPHCIDAPTGYPEWAGIRTDNADALPASHIIAAYLQRFHDGSGKELLITPKGLRMVVLVDQADRGGYLIFRDARFDSGVVTAELVRGVLDDLHRLREALAKPQEEDHVR